MRTWRWRGARPAIEVARVMCVCVCVCLCSVITHAVCEGEEEHDLPRLPISKSGERIIRASEAALQRTASKPIKPIKGSTLGLDLDRTHCLENQVLRGWIFFFICTSITNSMRMQAWMDFPFASTPVYLEWVSDCTKGMPYILYMGGWATVQKRCHQTQMKLSLYSSPWVGSQDRGTAQRGCHQTQRGWQYL